jgi:glycosyltransferase involved in cell wall biosynthesis
MKAAPAISVVLPVYNAEAYVREAVESILSQSFIDFELIIINDGSSDGSGDILRELAARDPRIDLIEQPNNGLVAALNEGIARAQAGLIARMDADDVAMPERLALQYARMEASPQLAVLGSFMRLMDGAGNVIRLADYPVTEADTLRFLEQGCPVAHPSVMMRRDVVLAVGGYRKAFAHCEDYDLWLRISERGFDIANIPNPLLNYRLHGTNVSSVHREAQELGTIIARLCHRARKAGYPDPAEGLEKLHIGMIEAIPVDLRTDMEAALFVARYSYLSLAETAELDVAWREYLLLERKVRSDRLLCDFLMRLIYGAVRRGQFGLVFRAFIQALRLHPAAAFGLIWRKIMARI